MALKIGMILDNEFPPDSRVESEAVSLIEAGHEVFLFSLTMGKRKTEEVFNGINVHRYPYSVLTYKLSALAYTIPLYHKIVSSKINDFIIRHKIEIIHVHDIQVARAVWMSNKKNLPIILDLHENRPEIMKYYRHVNTFQGKLLISPKTWEKFQNKYVKVASKVIVVTPHAKKELEQTNLKPGEDIVVVPNTVHPDIFINYPIQERIKNRFEGKFNILYLGDTGIRRGTVTAIESINLLKDKIPELNLILVGQNKEDVKLKKLVKELDLDSHVTFEGWKDVSLFPSYIQASQICISPLLRNKHHDTTYANKVFQYMAIGRPILVSNCPPQAEIIEKEQVGLVHEAGNPEDMSNKILMIHQDRNLRIEMGDRARLAFKKRWNWRETSNDLVNMYHNFSKTLI